MLTKQSLNSAKSIDEPTNSFQKGKCEEELNFFNYLPDFLHKNLSSLLLLSLIFRKLMNKK
jgi:hypothetical protein